MPAKHAFISHSAGGDPIWIRTSDITHAFIALTTHDWPHRNKVDNNGTIAALNREVFPKIWRIAFPVNFGCFAVAATASGYPNASKFPDALERWGLTCPYSIAMAAMEADFDGGALCLKVNAGFAFRDSTPRIYGNDGGPFLPIEVAS